MERQPDSACLRPVENQSELLAPGFDIADTPVFRDISVKGLFASSFDRSASESPTNHIKDKPVPEFVTIKNRIKWSKHREVIPSL